MPDPTSPPRAGRPWLAPTAVLALPALSLLAGCTTLSSVQLLLLAGQAVEAGSQVLAPPRASATVHFGGPKPQEVCVELNAQAQVPDLLPALQAELQQHGVRSRLIDRQGSGGDCSVWLRYDARMDYAVPPTESDYKPYLARARLSMVNHQGRLLASSAYEQQHQHAFSRWTSTRSKLAPVVQSLLQGEPS